MINLKKKIVAVIIFDNIGIWGQNGKTRGKVVRLGIKSKHYDFYQKIIS